MSADDDRYGEFVSTLAHDLQQPLFALNGFLELLAEAESLGDSERMLLTRAMANAQQLADIVEGVRAEAAAVDQGSGPLKPPG